MSSGNHPKRQKTGPSGTDDVHSDQKGQLGQLQQQKAGAQGHDDNGSGSGSGSQKPQQSWKSSVDEKGAFQRKASTFRNWISADGSTGFKAEPNRYHLYISHACPWAHRCAIVRSLKGLDSIISLNVVDWLLQEKGWRFNPERDEGCTADDVNNASHLREVYLKADPNYEGNITVPVLWDKQRNTIVNNESSEIIRMLNSEFNEWSSAPSLDLYPQELRAEIDAINEWVYPNINNGVYRCGFARSQAAYDEAFDSLFEHLDRAEEILGRQRYLTGNRLTEADIRLFTTLIRFDPVYVGHFKCNLKRIIDYPNLNNFMLELYQMPAIKPTINMFHIKHHYMESHLTINPLGIVSKGPLLDLDRPHDRDQRFPLH